MRQILFLLLLILAVAITPAAFSQSTRTTQYLLISVQDVKRGLGGIDEKIVVTRPDGTQEEKDYSFGAFYFVLGKMKAREDSVMAMLKPYFDDGWKLVTVVSFTIPQGSDGIVTRYFLKKDE